MTVPIMLLTILVVVALAQVGVEGDATTNDFMGSDTFWEYSQEKQAWEPVTAESMQYRLSKLDHELILASRLNATETSCTSSWPYRNAMGHADNASVTDYALSVLWSKSVFCVGDGGSVFERFWNEQIWVYVNHHSPLFEAASVTAYAGRMYVSARDGSVWERRRAGQELKWVNADVPAPHNVASPPRMDADGSLWFVSTAGHLLQCERKEGLATVCENWIDHRKPFGKCLAAVADASTFQRNTVFVVGVDGQLLQYDVRLQEWADLGRPVWASVGPAEAVALVNEQTGDRSMFLLSAEGTLIELFYRADPTTGANGGGATTAAHLGSTSTTSASSASSSSSPSSSDGSGNTGDSHNADAGSTVVVVTTEGEGEENQGKAGEATDEQRRRRLDGGGGGGDGDEDDHERHEKGDSALHWQWLDHGCPDGDRIVGPPGGLINMRSLFMVSANGTVYERYWDGTEWIWVSHGHSGVAMRPARPVALDNRHIFFLRQDGLITERFWNGIEWVWSVHGVPLSNQNNLHSNQDGSPGGGGGGGHGAGSGSGSSSSSSSSNNNNNNNNAVEAVSFCSPEIGARSSCAPPLFADV